MTAPAPGPDDDGADLKWFVFPLAFLSGFSMTLSAIVIAYPNYVASQNRTELGKCKKLVILMANLIFTGIGVGLGIYVSGYASVAITFPAALGMNLLSNMILQAILGIATFKKNFVVGTLVLTAAVVTLKDIGPEDPGDLPEDEVIKMLLTPLSFGFISVSLLAEVTGLCAVTRKWVTNNNALLFSYAVVGSSGTVLNCAIGKLVQMNLDMTVKVGLAIAYVINATLCLAVAALANGTLEDPSRFIPVTSGMNLCLTCLAGLCIWGDLARVSFPLAYAMIYVLILLGIYDVSDFDFHATNQPQDADLRRQCNVEDMVFNALNESSDHPGRPRQASGGSINSCPAKLQSREVRLRSAQSAPELPRSNSVELLDGLGGADLKAGS